MQLDDINRIVAVAGMYWDAHSDDFLPELMANETFDALLFGNDIEKTPFECLPTFTSTFTAGRPRPYPASLFPIPTFAVNAMTAAHYPHPYPNVIIPSLNIPLNLHIQPPPHPYQNAIVTLCAHPQPIGHITLRSQKITKNSETNEKKCKEKKKKWKKHAKPSTRLGLRRGPYRKTRERLEASQ